MIEVTLQQSSARSSVRRSSVGWIKLYPFSLLFSTLTNTPDTHHANTHDSNTHNVNDYDLSARATFEITALEKGEK